MTEKIKVLIGDDSAEFGLTWASLLKEEGMFAVTRQKNGRVILESVKNDMPRVLIVDAKMAELDAASLLGEIRNKTGRIPITIVVSNPALIVLNTKYLKSSFFDKCSLRF